jgi:hypothetical protein
MFGEHTEKKRVFWATDWHDDRFFDECKEHRPSAYLHQMQLEVAHHLVLLVRDEEVGDKQTNHFHKKKGEARGNEKKRKPELRQEKKGNRILGGIFFHPCPCPMGCQEKSRRRGLPLFFAKTCDSDENGLPFVSFMHANISHLHPSMVREALALRACVNVHPSV